MSVRPLKVNLMSLLNSVEQNKKRVKALTQFLKNNDVKREIGRRIADAIRERTQNGKDKNGNAFKKYSKAYIKSSVFKIWGKNKNDVNLVLTGDMQENIDVVKITNDTIELGFKKEREELKAEGHIKGSNYLPVRDFWGLPDKETLKEIMLDVIKNEATGRIQQEIEFISSVEKGGEVLFEA